MKNDNEWEWERAQNAKDMDMEACRRARAESLERIIAQWRDHGHDGRGLSVRQQRGEGVFEMGYFIIEDPAGLHAEETPLYDALLRSRIAWAKADSREVGADDEAEASSRAYWNMRERMSSINRAEES